MKKTQTVKAPNAKAAPLNSTPRTHRAKVRTAPKSHSLSLHMYVYTQSINQSINQSLNNFFKKNTEGLPVWSNRYSKSGLLSWFKKEKKKTKNFPWGSGQFQGRQCLL